MKSMRWFILVVMVSVLALAGCGGQPSAAAGISAQGAWVRAMMAGETPAGTGMATPAGGMQGQTQPTSGGMQGGVNSAGYMVLVNNTNQDDRLVRVEAAISGAVELHETKDVNGVMKMSPLENGIPIPAGGQVELKPGGMHVMFIGLKQDLKPGEKVTLTLVFEKAPPITMDVEIKQP